MEISSIIKSSMRKLGLLASGEAPTTTEYNDVLEAMQIMLRSWAAEKINVFATVRETTTLSSGTSSYTWGESGDISTTRPNKIVDVTVQDSSIDYPLDIISNSDYSNIADKTTTGIPRKLAISYTAPQAILYFYPVPDAAYTVTLNSVKPFTEEDSFELITDELAMPVFYEEAIVYNLAVRVAPEFGITVPNEVITVAAISYARILKINSSNDLPSVKLDFPAGTRSTYNIYSDRY